MQNVCGVEMPVYEVCAGCAAILMQQEKMKGLPEYTVPAFARMARRASLNSSQEETGLALKKAALLRPK